MKPVAFMLGILLVFIAAARVVWLRAATISVAYDIRKLRDIDAELKNDCAWGRAVVSSRAKLSALEVRARDMSLELSREGVVRIDDRRRETVRETSRP